MILITISLSEIKQLMIDSAVLRDVNGPDILFGSVHIESMYLG